MRARISRSFATRFGRDAELVVRSPGRVNLIGDHTDYNDGFVLPIAVDRSTWIAAARRTDRALVLSSHEFGDVRIDLDDLSRKHTWVDYVTGTIRELGSDLENGFDAIMHTELPVGAGLSSSAALELAVARLVVELKGAPWQPLEAAMAAQRAENEFMGVPCGIMDQLVVASAVAGTAMLLDCRSLEARLVPIPPAATVVVLDTGTRRRLIESAYEERRRECERASMLLGIATLRDITMEGLDAADLDSTARKRVRHVVTENIRAEAAADALMLGDLEMVGRFMDESHVSLRDDFEVSGSALDTITGISRQQIGCYGARMTGGGFAGCAVAIVATDHMEDFVATVGPRYDSVTGNASALYPTSAAEGVTLL